jgi:hypothetical protein
MVLLARFGICSRAEPARFGRGFGRARRTIAFVPQS